MNVCVIVLFVAKQCGNESSFRCLFCCFAKDDDDWLGCWFFEPPSDKQGKVNCRSVGWTNTPANSVYKHIHTNIQKFGKYTFFLGGGGRAEGHVCVVSVDAKSSVCFFAIDLCMRKKGKLRRTATTNRLFYLRHTYKMCLWFWKQNKKLNSLNFIMRQLRAVRSVPAQMDFLGRNCYYLPTSVRRQSAG